MATFLVDQHVTIDSLCTIDIFYSYLDVPCKIVSKKWLSDDRKTYAHTWACTPNFAKISIIFNKTHIVHFVRYYLLLQFYSLSNPWIKHSQFCPYEAKKIKWHKMSVLVFYIISSMQTLNFFSNISGLSFQINLYFANSDYG